VTPVDPPSASASASAGRPIRVAVLGGGVGAITAAFELTRPELAGRYELTVYQLGWRLGGKGASGRGVHGRIEEHGLHIWFGFYDNAFRAMRECYEELDRAPGIPIRTLEDAFHSAARFGVAEDRLDRWLDWVLTFPDNDEVPGSQTSTRDPRTVAGYLVRMLEICETVVRSLWDTTTPLTVVASAPATRTASGPIRAVARRPGVTFDNMIAVANQEVAALAEAADSMEIMLLVGAAELASSLESVADWEGGKSTALVALLDSFMDGFEDRITATIGDTPASERVLEVVDAFVTIALGLMRDGVVTDERGFSALDAFDLRDWLLLHGARTSTVEGGFVRGIYDLVFAYRDGRKDRPSLSAGVGLRGIMRMLFEYRGAFAYRMQAGMGDVVFAPYYEVLKQRGVRFEFFSEVASLISAEDGSRIEEVVVERQAHVKDDKPYEPLVSVHGLPCWPAEPDWDQLVDEGLGRHRNFESPWPEPVRVGEPIRLRADRDFDQIVFGLSMGSIPTVCRDLITRRPAWRDMVDNLATVPTQALQIWLSESSADLGADPTSPVVAGYIEPFDTWADMSHLLTAEDWPEAAAPCSIHYFCSPLPDPPDPADPDCQGRADALVLANATWYLNHAVGHFLPSAVDIFPPEFRWPLLVGAAGKSGPRAVASQHLRANVAPSERYVLSLPGTERFRLAPGDSGYDNLVLAGDWTSCELNAGCVEAATLSGLIAASEIVGDQSGRVIGLGGP
jgi:uncharacterized protein with NAD-binding domain and iron-sulfur cluster